MMLTCAGSFRALFSRLACEPCPGAPGRGGQAPRLNSATAALTLLAIVLTGCGPTRNEIRAESGVDAYFAGDYRGAIRRLRPLAEKTDENFVLNNCRLGSAALAYYDLDEAEAAFLKAYEVINSVGVNEGGRSIGAVVVAEKL